MSSIRPLLRSFLATSRPNRLIISKRTFSLSSARYNANVDPAFLAALKKTSVYRKIADRPEMLQAMSDLGVVMQKSGVNLMTGKPPSTLQMIKLAANAEFRAAVARMQEESAKAGIDFNSKEVMEEFMSVQQAKSKPKPEPEIRKPPPGWGEK